MAFAAAAVSSTLMDIKVKGSKKQAKYIKIDHHTIPFPEPADILEDLNVDQMMMDG